MKTLIAVSAICIGVSLIGCSNSVKEKNPPPSVAEAEESFSTANIPDTIKGVPDSSISADSPLQKKDLVGENKFHDDVNEIYRQLDVKPQMFSFEQTKDSEVVCAKGTKLKFKNSSFVDAETGREVTGKVNITVKEYYDMPEMLSANLSTSSHGEMLETTGMIYVDAKTNGKLCKLKKGSRMEIEFPGAQIKNGMQLFTGQRKNFENIDWIPVNDPDKTKQTGMIRETSAVTKYPVFPGGRDGLYSFLNREIKPQTINANNKGVKKVDVTLRIGTDGTVEKTEISKVENKELNNAIVSAMRKMPSWSPAEKDGKKVKVFYRITLNFIADNLYIENSKYSPEAWTAGRNVIYDSHSRLNKEEFEKNISDSMLQTTDVGKVGAYLFSSATLGWINCDRFLNEQKNIIAFKIDAPEEGASNIMVVFKNMNSMMSAAYNKERKGYYFERFPDGEPVTLIAIKTFNGKNFIAIKETTTSATTEKLVFQPVTVAQIKEQMKNL
ncbi:MAG: energy transducer TonB [Bacteroidia bacterium]|nr:energy transducer TonB [Bacteroidia bacterium]